MTVNAGITRGRLWNKCDGYVWKCDEVGNINIALISKDPNGSSRNVK